jgi:hypothetical protein
MQQMLRMHNVINEKGNAVVNSFQLLSLEIIHNTRFLYNLRKSVVNSFLNLNYGNSVYTNIILILNLKAIHNKDYSVVKTFTTALVYSSVVFIFTPNQTPRDFLASRNHLVFKEISINLVQ